MPDPPVTPTKPALLSSQQYDSTPIQLKLASGAVGEDKTYDSIDPLLRVDLEKTIYEITLDKFIDKFMGVPSSDMSSLQEAFNDVAKDTEIIHAVNAYISAANEHALYAPFSKMANHILTRASTLKSDLSSFPMDLTFVRNDPTLIKGANASRKPDVVGVSKKRIEALWDESEDRRNPSVSETPPNIRWVDIYVLVEFKHLPKANFDIEDFNKASVPQPQPSISLSASEHYPPTHSTASGYLKRKAEDAPDVPGAKKRVLSGEAKPVLVGATAVIVQCAGCAAELMTSTGGTRVHAWGMSLVDSTMRLSIYDASGVMHAASFDFLREFSKFAAIIVIFAGFGRERWGVQTAVNYPPKLDTIPVSLEGSTLNCTIAGVDQVITIGKMISSRHGLVGKNTNVHEGECKGVAHKLAVKFSQPLRSRARSEWDIIQRAKRYDIEGIPDVLHFEQFQTLCSRLRGELFGLVDWDPPYDDRRMTILVSKLYRPLCELSGDKYLKPFQDAVRCHHNLYKMAGILHRDISIGNLMYDQHDGIPYGIVNDYDNAIVLDEEGNTQAPPSKHRTGTIPFMALDLLGPDPAPRHLYRHDLESFFYVIVWTAVFHPREERNKKSGDTLHTWYRGDAMTRFSIKQANVLDSQLIESLTFTDSFRALKKVVLMLHLLFFLGHLERLKLQVSGEMQEMLGIKVVDDKTLGGNATFEHFNICLDTVV